MRHLDYKTLCLSLLISYGCVWWLLSFLMQFVVGSPAPGTVKYSNALWVLIPAYLAVPPLIAGCMVARTATNRPMLHALIAAVVGAAVYAIDFVLLTPIPLVLTAVGAGLYLRTVSRRADRRG
ncbi:hypothetical protein I6G96_24235 [Delftia acidovorans]|jgi:hypothetical protein|uniref:hypothetical protein n=1 Tax=Delftia acidovorans TaxID=80866 RepID=UPI0018D97411|nr:hypothetical protein [Delftia acidovorans]QPR34013.1 hypothetical protein I6G96_24235 [Delftia acidovorans]